MTAAQIVPAIVVPLIVWRIYLRVRRNIGRQHWRPGRLIASAVIFSVVATLIGLAAFRSPAALAALGGGLIVGAGVAMIALKLTRFETVASEKYYTPNTVIGVGVTLLLIGRLVYRIIFLSSAAADRASAPQFFQSPVTLGIFGVTAGFYIAYALGVYFRGRALT